jgi:sulfite reductase beta subunit-like hemoprotein
MPAKPDLTPIEKDKLMIDPDFDFRDIAARPFEDLKTNEIGMFKWTGIYHQLQKGFFMMRVRIPGGVITADQLDKFGEVAEVFGQDEICITTRQTFQYHWLRKDDLYRVLEELKKVGIDSKNCCGDVNRNMTTCPLQGVCEHEIGDVRDMIMKIADDPEVRDEQRNLPRKHKMCIAGCGRACGLTLMNDESWHPVKRKKADGSDETGWAYYAGGGLGARPFMAKLIYSWVPEELVLEVTRAGVEVYRRLGNRRVRAFARLKFVVDKLGAEGYGNEVMAVLKERAITNLERIEVAKGPADILPSYVDGQAVFKQRQKGFSTVRALILRSEMKSADCRRFANWARTYGDGSLMLTARQNIELRFIPDAKVDALVKEIHAAGYSTEGFERLPDMVACVGTTECNLAVSDTPNTYHRLYDEFAKDKALWEKVGHLRIHMNGCPNSCAQHWIADIGLRGMRKEGPAGSEEGFTICVGGSVGGAGHIAQPVCDVSSSAVVPTMRRMLELYLEHRTGDQEQFGDFARRIGPKKYAALLGVPPAPEEAAYDRNLRLQPVYDQVISETMPW